MFVDYYHNHKNIIRFVVTKKSSLLKNIYHVPNIMNIVYKFKLHKLDDLDDVQIYNYIYLFKSFMGRRSVLTKYKSFFNLGIWTYSLTVCIFITNNCDKYNNFYKYLSHYLFVTENLFLNNYRIKRNEGIFLICLRDLSILTDRKTNLGLFYILTNLYTLTTLQGAYKNILLFVRNIKMKRIR